MIGSKCASAWRCWSAYVQAATPMALWSVRATRGCAPLRDYLSGSGTINYATSTLCLAAASILIVIVAEDRSS